MFEKEGIKYAIEETVGTECLSMPIEDFHFIDLAESQQEKAQCFKDGAEFGYNKAKEELAERLDEAKEMLEQFIKFSMFPLTTKKDIEDVQILLKSASQFCKEME